jgi:hypothetical protein
LKSGWPEGSGLRPERRSPTSSSMWNPPRRYCPRNWTRPACTPCWTGYVPSAWSWSTSSKPPIRPLAERAHPPSGPGIRLSPTSSRPSDWIWLSALNSAAWSSSAVSEVRAPSNSISKSSKAWRAALPRSPRTVIWQRYVCTMPPASGLQGHATEDQGPPFMRPLVSVTSPALINRHSSHYRLHFRPCPAARGTTGAGRSHHGPFGPKIVTGGRGIGQNRGLRRLNRTDLSLVSGRGGPYDKLRVTMWTPTAGSR